MRLSIAVTNFSWPDGSRTLGPRVSRIARIADQAGFHTLWTMDHLFQISINGPAEADMLECYTTLAYVAGQTERIRLGVLVTATPYRHPGVLVKTVTTLDVLSGGRAWLGLGAAWNDFESKGLGIPFPPTAERYERLEETLRIARQMWAGDTTQFQGQHYLLENPINNPNTLQDPRPPILIGGQGERKTLRLVAEYADACNLFDAPPGTAHIPTGPDVLKHKLDVLARHCENVGRPYAEIEKTVTSHVSPSRDGRGGTNTPAEIVEHFAELAALGIDHAIVETPYPWDEESLDLIAGIVPELKRIVPAGR
ncbi:LLM class F420-dependent oxidoreductase [Actinopolymorpha alba]|uniref:LLM class F420-dependent oxidoreductase n=1 Tax=Actinopolymorpha alba TaxID=533267 RepID=UPI00035D82F7|nr:LLM class F420-dependent oxidoreductase [Actinopolymorpha alba]